ncbi:NAD(P)H-hydrate dehydratase, partial [Campylobacter coli]|nr:NAD(P)H-hydrate dehydratase [Campylobacter coli]
LLGVKFSALEAAKNACLAHALVAKKYKFNKNSFDAIKLIKGLKCL